jgi:hypothetical protein
MPVTPLHRAPTRPEVEAALCRAVAELSRVLSPVILMMDPAREDEVVSAKSTSHPPELTCARRHAITWRGRARPRMRGTVAVGASTRLARGPL